MGSHIWKESTRRQGREKEMNDIFLERFCYHPKGTLGVIKFAGETFYSVERPWLDNEPNVSCVPEGTYDVHWRESPKFGHTWELKDVENRTYILMHVANFPKDVQGCIGLGTSLMGDTVGVGDSRNAMKMFNALTKDIEWRIVIKHAKHAAL
jgi:hypothetical protein|tara:strand:+ start:1115 stop:1570 length:456 start_codon:yes stop_codon:yes gene_type:complete